MGKCFRCGEEVEGDKVVCRSCLEGLKNTYNVNTEEDLIEDMANYIKDNSTPSLIELVVKAIKISEEK